ncbi:hypothetical protein PGC35_20930 [Psychrobacillus sp. PGGUH221]|jgi:DNA-3-methyladenine glycosylase II|uniref:hypothetical protein n=1 Tax=Psychrobacillus sp. PGGUH221 TaxID=3020058 RepID=UPI0035C71953
MDVLYLGDIGLQRAAKWLYNEQEEDEKILLQQKSILWEPYRTISSLYLWEIINCGLIKKKLQMKFYVDIV